MPRVHKMPMKYYDSLKTENGKWKMKMENKNGKLKIENKNVKCKM